MLSLILHIFVCLKGLINATFNFSTLGPGLPLISKLELYVNDPSAYTYLGQFDFVLFTIPVVLGFVTASAPPMEPPPLTPLRDRYRFVTARASAIASLACFALFGVIMIDMTYGAKFGQYTKPLLAQHRQARIVLRQRGEPKTGVVANAAVA